MKKRRDQSDCIKKALQQKFKEVLEEVSPPAGLEFSILQRMERENVNSNSNFFTGIRCIISLN